MSLVNVRFYSSSPQSQSGPKAKIAVDDIKAPKLLSKPVWRIVVPEATPANVC